MAKPRGVVAAGHPATAAAADLVLREGGNAFDAALAAVCAATVAEPVLSSLGGGGFLLARPAEGAPCLYDFFCQTPRRKRPEDELDFHPIVADFGTTQQEFHIGMGSMAVPGMVKGLFRVHGDLGRMPLTEIVAPALDLAKQGIVLNRLQAYIFSVVGPIYVSNPTILAQFESQSRPGELCGEGDAYRAPDCADALDALAREGDDLFYRGEMARRLTDDCRDHGGCLTPDDLEGYRVERRSPLALDLDGARLLTNPPPSTGGILVVFALELLRGAALAADGFGGRRHAETLLRAMSLTNEARIEAALGETDGAAEALLHPGFLELYRRRLLGAPKVSRGTTHIGVIDAAGNAAGVTVSNGEGCGYILPGTGIVLNNMLGEEDINPHGFHRWPTDTRLASMMAPTLLQRSDGSLVMLGSGGSNRIRTALLQVLINLERFGMPLEEAVAAPRLHFERGDLGVEPGYPEAVLASLAADPEVAHLRRWEGPNLFFGGVHAVARTASGGLDGAGDPRRGGVAVMVT